MTSCLWGSHSSTPPTVHPWSIKNCTQIPFPPQSCLPNRPVFLALLWCSSSPPKQHDWRKTSPVQQTPTEFMTAWFKQALPLAWQCGSKLGFPCVPTPILPTSPRWRMEVSKGDAAIAPKSTSLSHLHSLHPLFVCHWEASPYYQKQSCRCLFSTLSCFLRARLLRIHPPLLQQ